MRLRRLADTNAHDQSPMLLSINRGAPPTVPLCVEFILATLSRDERASSQRANPDQNEERILYNEASLDNASDPASESDPDDFIPATPPRDVSSRFSFFLVRLYPTL